MNKGMVEALFQNDMDRAKEAFEEAVKAAKQRRTERLEAIREADRAAYRSEQEFFYQG